MDKLSKYLTLLFNNKEISIIIIVIFVLFMMIVPLNPTIMDIIIGFNISVSVLILMVVLYLQSSIGLTSFPGILLVLALIRIGITVSTSRLILLDANAGEIVQTFGEFVAGGNLVVGTIVFAIITIINFIVITKGSERVAEVAARFSLDAMPGKQMSIDSDLKAGNLTMEQANLKRKNLALESKLYGAMDGAMKFVKGDAIASIIDILINLVGGLIVGVVQKKLSFSDAATTYSILTIGDGLVQQVPALLISLTAGIMITKVNDEDTNENVGQNILKQIFTNHKALFSASALLFCMSFVPGLPAFVFLSLMMIFIIIGVVLFRSSKRGASDINSNSAVKEDLNEINKDIVDYNKDEQVDLHMTPLAIYFSPKIKGSNYIKSLKSIVFKIRQEVANDLGVLLPPIMIRYDSSYSDYQYQFEIFEIPESFGEGYWNSILILDQEEIELLNIDTFTKNTYQFGNKNLGVWVAKSYDQLCLQNKIFYYTYEDFLALHIKYHIDKHIAKFLGIQETKNMLDKLQDYQDLIKELLRMLPLNKITEVFQRLISENISLRNFKVILDTMLEWGQREKDVVIITEHVRKSLGRYIAYKFSRNTYMFSCIMLSLDIEDTIRDSIRYTEAGSYLALDPRVTDEMIAQLDEILSSATHLKNIVVLCQFDIRRYVRSVFEVKYSYIPVLSFQELEGYAEFNNIGIIEALIA